MCKSSLRYADIVFIFPRSNNFGTGSLNGEVANFLGALWSQQTRTGWNLAPILSVPTSLELRRFHGDPTSCKVKHIYYLALYRNNYADSCVIFHSHEVCKHLASRLNSNTARLNPFRVAIYFSPGHRAERKTPVGSGTKTIIASKSYLPQPEENSWKKKTLHGEGRN